MRWRNETSLTDCNEMDESDTNSIRMNGLAEKNWAKPVALNFRTKLANCLEEWQFSYCVMLKIFVRQNILLKERKLSGTFAFISFYTQLARGVCICFILSGQECRIRFLSFYKQINNMWMNDGLYRLLKAIGVQLIWIGWV